MDHLSIGAVVDLTGIPAHTLRKWETRHSLVVPVRTASGRRVYTQAQVEALRLVRTLHQLGHSLASLAPLSLEELQALAAQHEMSEPAFAVSSLLVVGPTLCASFARQDHAGVAVTLKESDAAHWLGSGDATDAEAILVEVPSLTLDLAERLVELADRHQGSVLVAYAFATRQTLRALRLRNVFALAMPVEPETVFALLSAGHRPRQSGEDAPARFTGEQLARIAAMSPSIQCECPNHIARLLMEIGAFEEYCAQCEDSDPKERALHEHLGRVTAQARALFEEALVAVADADGLELS